jgi:hypothetical protein
VITGLGFNRLGSSLIGCFFFYTISDATIAYYNIYSRGDVLFLFLFFRLFIALRFLEKVPSRQRRVVLNLVPSLIVLRQGNTITAVTLCTIVMVCD